MGNNYDSFTAQPKDNFDFNPNSNASAPTFKSNNEEMNNDEDG